MESRNILVADLELCELPHVLTDCVCPSIPKACELIDGLSTMPFLCCGAFWDKRCGKCGKSLES